MALKRKNLANNPAHFRDGEEAMEYLFTQGKFAPCNPENILRLALPNHELSEIGRLEVQREIKSNRQIISPNCTTG